jgi:hypothetical protein
MTRVSKKKSRSRQNANRLFDSHGIPHGSLQSLLDIPPEASPPVSEANRSLIRGYRHLPSKNSTEQAAFETSVSSSQALVQRPLPKPSRIPQPTFPISTRPRISRLRNPDVEAQLAAQRKDLLTLKRPPPIISKTTSELLAGTCNILGSVLSKPITPVPEAQITSAPVIVSPDIVCVRRGNMSSWAKILTTVTIKGPMRKTIGCIQYANSKDVLITSSSGYAARSPASVSHQEMDNRFEDSRGQLLDASVWTEAVEKFCELIGFELPGHRHDYNCTHERLGHDGRFYACHAEKTLILYFLYHYLTDGGKSGVLSERKLWDLRSGKEKLEAILHIDRAPCGNCLGFRDRVQASTRIRIDIQVFRTVMQAERFKDGNQIKYRLATNLKIPTEHIPGKGERKLQGKNIASQKERYRRKMNSRTTIFVETSPTPTRRTRKSGLLKPSELVFSFDALDLLDRRRGRRKDRQAGRQMGVQNFSIPTDTPRIQKPNPSPKAESISSPITRRTIRMNGVLTLSPSVFEVSFDTLDRLDRRRGRRGARSGKRTYVD